MMKDRRLAVMLLRTVFLTSCICCSYRALSKASSPKRNFKAEREAHVYKTLADPKYSRLAGLSEMNIFKDQILNPMLIERVADTDGNMYTQEHIKYWMGQKLGWHIEDDSFDDITPYNVRSFRNIIATLDPSADRFLTLACHFDSKYFEEFEFIGATDSAVPCAMLIDLARTLNYSLYNGKDSQGDGISLQFIFFDGEEAFVQWSDEDSIYGARHLAEKWEKAPHPQSEDNSILDGMDALILLDLIGTRNPTFRNYFSDKTDTMYKRMQSIESKLHKAGLLEQHSHLNEYFTNKPAHGGVEDDHIPFLRRGVPILHMIPTPFPYVWHRETDNESCLHYPTINNLNKIMRIFVSEYLHLQL